MNQWIIKVETNKSQALPISDRTLANRTFTSIKPKNPTNVKEHRLCQVCDNKTQMI